MNIISSVDMSILTVFKRELLDIEAMGVSVPPIVIEYLSERIKSIESGNPEMDEWVQNKRYRVSRFTGPTEWLKKERKCYVEGD